MFKCVCTRCRWQRSHSHSLHACPCPCSSGACGAQAPFGLRDAPPLRPAVNAASMVGRLRGKHTVQYAAWRAALREAASALHGEEQRGGKTEASPERFSQAFERYTVRLGEGSGLIVGGQGFG